MIFLLLICLRFCKLFFLLFFKLLLHRFLYLNICLFHCLINSSTHWFFNNIQTLLGFNNLISKFVQFVLLLSFKFFQFLSCHECFQLIPQRKILNFRWLAREGFVQRFDYSFDLLMFLFIDNHFFLEVFHRLHCHVIELLIVFIESKSFEFTFDASQIFLLGFELHLLIDTILLHTLLTYFLLMP